MGDYDGCVALGSYFCPFKDKHVEQRCEDVGEAVIQCRRAQRPSVQGRAPGWTAPHVINMIQPQQRKATCINMPQAPERVHDVKPPHGWHSALTVCIGSALQQEADGGQRPHPRSQVQQAVAVWPVRQAGAPAAASGGKRFLISKAREAGAPAAGAQQRGKVWISKATHVARTERHANVTNVARWVGLCPTPQGFASPQQADSPRVLTDSNSPLQQLGGRHVSAHQGAGHGRQPLQHSSM